MYVDISKLMVCTSGAWFLCICHVSRDWKLYNSWCSVYLQPGAKMKVGGGGVGDRAGTPCVEVCRHAPHFFGQF